MLHVTDRGLVTGPSVAGDSFDMLKRSFDDFTIEIKPFTAPKYTKILSVPVRDAHSSASNGNIIVVKIARADDSIIRFYGKVVYIRCNGSNRRIEATDLLENQSAWGQANVVMADASSATARGAKEARFAKLFGCFPASKMSEETQSMLYEDNSRSKNHKRKRDEISQDDD